MTQMPKFFTGSKRFICTKPCTVSQMPLQTLLGGLSSRRHLRLLLPRARTCRSAQPCLEQHSQTFLCRPSTASDDLRKCCMRLFSHGNALAFADICNDDNVVMKAAATLNCSASPNDIALVPGVRLPSGRRQAKRKACRLSREQLPNVLLVGI